MKYTKLFEESKKELATNLFILSSDIETRPTKMSENDIQPKPPNESVPSPRYLQSSLPKISRNEKITENNKINAISNNNISQDSKAALVEGLSVLSSKSAKELSTTSFKPSLNLYRNPQNCENEESTNIASSSESDSSDEESSDDDEIPQPQVDAESIVYFANETNNLGINPKRIGEIIEQDTSHDPVVLSSLTIEKEAESHEVNRQSNKKPNIEITAETSSTTADSKHNLGPASSQKNGNSQSRNNIPNDYGYKDNNSAENQHESNTNNEQCSYLSNTSSILKPQRSHRVPNPDDTIQEDSQKEDFNRLEGKNKSDGSDVNSEHDDDAFVEDINNLRVIDQRSPMVQRKESVIQHSVAIPVINKKSTTEGAMEVDERIQNSVREEPTIPLALNKNHNINSETFCQSTTSYTSSSSSSSDDDNDYDSEIEQFMYEPDNILDGYSNSKESALNNGSYPTHLNKVNNDKIDLQSTDPQLLNSRIGKKLKLQREMNPETSKNDKEGSIANTANGNIHNNKSSPSDSNDMVNGSLYELNNLILGTGYNSPGGSGLTINNVHLGENSINYMNHNINIRKLNDELHLDYFNMRNFHNPLIKTIKSIYEYNKKNPLDFLALKRTSDAGTTNKPRTSGSTINDDNLQVRQSHLQSFDSNRSTNVNKSLRNELMHLYTLQYNDNSSDTYSIRTKKTKRKHNLLMYSYENELFNMNRGNNYPEKDLDLNIRSSKNKYNGSIKPNSANSGANLKKKSGTTNLGKLLVRDSENTNLINKVFDECITTYLNNHIVSMDYLKSQYIDVNSTNSQSISPSQNNFMNKGSKYSVPLSQFHANSNNKANGSTGNNGKKYNSMLNNAVTNNFNNSRTNSNLTTNNGNSSDHSHPTTKAQRYQHMKESNNQNSINSNQDQQHNSNNNKVQQNPMNNTTSAQQKPQSQNENTRDRGQYSNILNGDFLLQDMKSLN